jgi:hypothetical protein
MSGVSSMREFEYLGRQVRFFEAGSPEEIGAASSATMLFWVCRPVSNPNERSALIRSIIVANPLAILIAGVGARELFGELLSALDLEKEPRPILTKLSEADEEGSAEDFLKATWPYESRFDHWAQYYVVSYGAADNKLKCAVELALSNA